MANSACLNMVDTDPKKKRMIRLALTELGKEVYLKTREAETLKRIVSKLTPKKEKLWRQV